MNTKRLAIIAVMILSMVMFLGLASTQASVQLNFDPGSITLSPTQATGAWYTDRYAPATFESAVFDGDNRLHVGILASDLQSDSFHNFQGRKYDINLTGGQQRVSIDLFVSSAWENTDTNVGFWVTGVDANNDVSAYPILAYRNNDVDSAGIYMWDYIDGGWINDPGVTADEWHNLSMVLTVGVGMEYFVDGTSIGTFVDADTVSLGNVILNHYNFGSDYDVYWDNLTGETVPEPGTMIVWALLATASWLGMGVWRRGQPAGRQPWSDENRTAIFDIIDRDRT